MEKKSPHILNASSNLLGFCLVIITSLRIAKISNSSFIDEFAGVASVCLIVSCTLSFLAIRSKKENLENRYEKIADYLFLIALFSIGLCVIFVSLNFMK